MFLVETSWSCSLDQTVNQTVPYSRFDCVFIGRVTHHQRASLKIGRGTTTTFHQTIENTFAWNENVRPERRRAPLLESMRTQVAGPCFPVWSACRWVITTEEGSRYTSAYYWNGNVYAGSMCMCDPESGKPVEGRINATTKERDTKDQCKGFHSACFMCAMGTTSWYMLCYECVAQRSGVHIN